MEFYCTFSVGIVHGTCLCMLNAKDNQSRKTTIDLRKIALEFRIVQIIILSRLYRYLREQSSVWVGFWGTDVTFLDVLRKCRLGMCQFLDIQYTPIKTVSFCIWFIVVYCESDSLVGCLGRYNFWVVIDLQHKDISSLWLGILGDLTTWQTELSLVNMFIDLS